MTTKKRDIDTDAMRDALNNLEAETGQTTQLVVVMLRLMMGDFSSPDTEPLRAMVDALEHQQARVNAAQQAAWDAYFGRTATDAPAADPATAQAAH